MRTVRLIHLLLLFGSIAAAACGNRPDTSRETSGGGIEPPGQTVPNAPGQTVGLSTAEAESISQAAVSYLRQKRYQPISEGLATLPPGPCGNPFRIDGARIVDASLNGQVGRIQVIASITPESPLQSYNGALIFPGLTCFGVPRDRWVQGQSQQVAFQFNVERWESGWRLSQTQGR